VGSFPDSPFDACPSTPVEQRLFLRKKVSIPLTIELFPGKEVWLDDLGEGGLSVSGSSRLEPGAPTFLTFEFPAANAVIEAAGQVAWCESSGRAGVRFTRIKPDSAAAVKRWLKACEAEPAAQTSTGTGILPKIEHSAPGLSNDLRKLLGDIDYPKLGNQQTFERVVAQMLRLTRATGAAIAWRMDENVICQASAGNAPPAGTKLKLDSGFTSECYRSGKIVSLSDCENDVRIDVELRRELDFRSLLIVPIRCGEEVIGVAEVLSTLPGNFDGGDILLLASIAEFIGQNYTRKLKAETPHSSFPSP
jgi:putative methionine-R-sulfoxide reductase with GAF domain